MVRKYIRRTEKAKWTAEDLKKAKQAVDDGLSMRKAEEILEYPLAHCKSG